MPDYLNNVNPAGTVPVLLHNGHPIYESHEQIMYIDKVLMPEGRSKLTPQDPKKKALVDKYVELGSMFVSEVMQAADPWEGIAKRAGNLLPFMTLPFFCGNCILHFGPWTMLETLFMVPLVRDTKFIMRYVPFKIFGVEAFRKFKFLEDIMAQTRRGINYHFSTLTKDLESSGGPYICGKEYTLADISMVPIFERMEVARWWTDSVKVRATYKPSYVLHSSKMTCYYPQAQFPPVHQYWEAIQKRDGYKDSKPDSATQDKLDRVGRQIDQWKVEHSWFRDYYEKR